MPAMPARRSAPPRTFRIRHLLLRPHSVAYAVYALLKARLALSTLRGSDIAALNSQGLDAGGEPEEGQADAIRSRVAVAIPLLARMVPWRSDCLVQALAAHRWLKRHGIRSAIHIGATPLANAGLDAHAWLISGERVITGANLKEYRMLIGAGPDIDAQAHTQAQSQVQSQDQSGAAKGTSPARNDADSTG